MANIQWGQFPPGFYEAQTIEQFFVLKSTGKQALSQNNLALANAYYSAALTYFECNPRQVILPQLANEYHVILCNRSLVLYKQGFYQQAEDDALAAIEICPRYLKGYWRASQAIIARSRDKQDVAMEYLAEGLRLTLQGEGNVHDKANFLSEVCKLAIEAPLTDKLKPLLHSLQLPSTTDNVWLSVLKKLCDQDKWKSIAMLLIQYDSRNLQHPLNTLDVSKWDCGNISLGKLLNKISDDSIRQWGERLAVCLLDKGASIDSLGQYHKTYALHFVVKLSLRIDSVILLRHVLENYKGHPEKMNIQDESGNTAVHLLVKSGKENSNIVDTVMTLLLNNKCDISIKDRKDKKPIEYLQEGSKLFALLKEKPVVKDLRKRLEVFKSDGNKAHKNKDYTTALQQYDKACEIAQQSRELYKEAAILYSNKSNVLYQMKKYEDALVCAIAAINSNPEYSKGYYWKGKALLCLGSAKDAFLTLFDDCAKSRNDLESGYLLTEAATVLDSLASTDFQTCYERLSNLNVNSSVWSQVLIQLSRRMEWKSIAYLILGTNLDMHRLGEPVTAKRRDQLCTGVAGQSSTTDVETRTVFKYLEQHNGNDIAQWLDAVLLAVYLQGGEQTLQNFSVDQRDCPLHAITRFVLQTGRTSLLEVFPRQSPTWCATSAAGESVFHILAKHVPPLPEDFLLKVTTVLLEKGYSSIMTKDMNGKLPFDHLDVTYPMSVLDLFLPDDACEIKMERLNHRGASKSHHGDHCEAISMFSKAIALCQQNSQRNRCIYKYLLRNRAESYLQQKEYQKALNDSNESMKFHNSQEAHWIAGRALTGLKKYEQACKKLLYAYDYCTAFDQQSATDILSDLAKLFSQRTKDQYYGKIGNGTHGHIWAQVCHLLIQMNDWKSAREVILLFEMDRNPPIIPLKLDLKPFCSIKDIKSCPGVANIILYLLHCGSDKLTISLEEGDTYLHAAVRITLVAKWFDLLQYLLQHRGVSDTHMRDSNCNTLLHVATKEKKVDKKLRYFVIKVLLDCGVDPHVRNNENNEARSYLSGEQKNKHLILQSMQTKGKQTSHYNQRGTKTKSSDTHVVGNDKKEKPRTCENCQRLYSDAIDKLSADKTGGLKLFVDLFNMDHPNKHHSKIEKKALDEFVKNIGEISKDDMLVCLKHLQKKKYFTVIDGFFGGKKWLALIWTIEQFKMSFNVRELKKFASNFTVESLIGDNSLSSEEEELRVAGCLLDNGWRIGDDNGRVAVKNAIELKKFKLGLELIERGADISLISVYDGDTPIHAAIRIALQEKQLVFIQKLLDTQEREKDKYVYLDPEQVDVNGDCIYHLVAKADYSDFVLRLTEILCSKNISAHFYNKEGKYPSDYVNKRHFRLFNFLQEAYRIKPSREQVFYKEPQNDKRNNSSEDKTMKTQESNLNNQPQPLTEPIEDVKKRVEKLISALPANVAVKKVDRHTPEIKKNVKDITMPNDTFSTDHIVTKQNVVGMAEHKPNNLQKDNARQENGAREFVNDDSSCDKEIILVKNKIKDEKRTTLEDIAKTACFALKHVQENDFVARSDVSGVEDHDISGPPPLESDDDFVDDKHIKMHNAFKTLNVEKKEDRRNVMADADGELERDNLLKFEDLTWEVEYTDKVRKVLEDKKVVQKTKDKIVKIIQTLAKGEWQNNLCRELKNVPPTLRLFKANLSRASRIIWEKAIGFSSRCSGDTALFNRFQEDTASKVRGGRIYTELIRIWDIVLDHDKVQNSVDAIKLSHQRGETCVIQRKLKGLKREHDQRIRTSGITYPLLYTENGPKDDSERQVQVKYFPPASADEAEYHILKFYHWNTTLENLIKQSSNVKVDFPFKVTDLEHAIINLSGKEAILLLGRSGTGKTTCCLYRLWSQFRMYWYNRPIDAPLLPGSERIQVHDNNNPESEEAAEGTGQCCCEENTEHEKNGCEEDDKNGHENEETRVEDSKTCDHFHQIFVTKNSVLATEVKKTFRDFINADEILSKDHSKGIDDQALPNRLQDLQENAYPLFLTSRQLLCKIDASIGNPFFERQEDGSLKYHVDGWADIDEEITDLTFLDYDSADEDTSVIDDTVNAIDDGIGVDRIRKDDANVRREVTYDVFENEFWPKLEIKANAAYHPSLVWTEIMSFIKGSYESLSNPNDYLSKDEYIKLGRKRAPNFSGERDEVYDIFVVYERRKKQLRMFDETDVVHSVFRRLAEADSSPVAIHQIYVDETQDFTQAELFLLIRLCQNPNNIFLTGDTAQSIMRGISFRFNDLRSLFFHVQQMTDEAKRTSKASKSLTVHVPNTVHKLTYNYRSHSGILSLASSILNIMSHFFPESFDSLPPDQGLFRGPEPILLESCSFSDLAVLLRGNKRKTSNIEFGAHQVILVVNEEARECLPEELSCGLVLTIYESKGLEFDDVLLYNFFKDSQASKEWRVVTKYLHELASNVTSQQTEEMFVAIDQDELSSKDRPRPLQFDPNLHKILIYELKQLYTALTRARVNVWIFDEDSDKRGPMFEYFKARKLVKPVEVTELNEESLSKSIFVVESDSEDWIQRGDYFMKNRLYDAAAKCFRRGGDRKKQELAQAHCKALVASRRKDKKKELKTMQAEFLYAAEMYLKCEQLSEAAKCLSNAKEMTLATTLYEKLGQYDKAAELCKKNRQFEECSRFYELSEKFNKAVSILYENGIFDLALDVVKRYKMRETEMVKNDNPALEQLRANKPDAIYTVEKISLRAAEDFHRRKHMKGMHEAVNRFKYEDDKIEFYKRNGYVSDAAKMLANAGRFPEAIHVYLKTGDLKSARDMAMRSNDDRLIAKCLLDISRVIIANIDEMERNYDTIQDDLKKALSVFQKNRDRNMSGQLMILQSQLYGDIQYVLSAGREFVESRPYPNEAGYLECCNLLKDYINHSNEEILKFLLKGTDCLFKVCKTFLLKSSSSNIESEIHAKFQIYCQFYGIFQKSGTSLVTFPETRPLCAKMLQHTLILRSDEVSGLETERNINTIVHYLLKESQPWLKFVRDTLVERRASLQMCRSFELGQNCTGNDAAEVPCNMMHKAHTTSTFKQLIETDLRLIEYEVYCTKADDILKCCKTQHSKPINNILSDMKSSEVCIDANEKYGACRLLWKDLLPESGHPWFLAEESSQVIKLVRTNKIVLGHMKHYLLNRWKESIAGGRKIQSRAVKETETFLVFEFAYHLFHFNTGRVNFEKSPKQEMIVFENALDNELIKGKNPMEFKGQEKKYTLMITFPDERNNPTGRAFITCVAHRFTDAYEHLIKGDLFGAILSFGKFQTQLSQRKLSDRTQVSFYPDIHHYLLWLEFYSSLAFYLISKAKSQTDTEFTFILPNNYRALLQFIEATFPKKSQSISQSILSRTPKKNHQAFENILLERVKRFAFVISGHAQGEKIPEIILKKCQTDRKEHVLLERLIILNMTMLCNTGKCVPIKCETSLLRSMNSTLSSPSIPSRLKIIQGQAKEFKGIRDVANCLIKLLQSRNLGETMLAMKWTPNLNEECKVSPVDVNLLSSTFLYQTPVAIETQDSVEDVPEDTELTKEEVTRTLQEKDELESKENTQEKQTTTIDSVSSNDIILDFVCTDDKECMVCGIGFESYLSNESTEEKPLETGESQNMRQQKDSVGTVPLMQRQGSQIDNTTYREMLLKAKEKHENEAVHRRNIEDFERFKHTYENDLKPVIVVVSDFLQKYNLFDETYKEEIERMKRNQTRIDTELTEIFYDRKWSKNTEYVKQIARELRNDYDLINHYAEEQTTRKQTSPGAAGRETNAVPNAKKGTEENELEKVVPEPVKWKRRYRTGKERRESRKKKKKT